MSSRSPHCRISVRASCTCTPPTQFFLTIAAVNVQVLARLFGVRTRVVGIFALILFVAAVENRLFALLLGVGAEVVNILALFLIIAAVLAFILALLLCLRARVLDLLALLLRVASIREVKLASCVHLFIDIQLIELKRKGLSYAGFGRPLFAIAPDRVALATAVLSHRLKSRQRSTTHGGGIYCYYAVASNDR